MYIPTWVIIACLIVAIIYFIIKKNNDGTRVHFRPFSVHIGPEWYPLLKEYEAIDETGWKTFQEKIDKYEEEGNRERNVISHGIRFDVLKADEDYDLIFNKNNKYFRSVVDFEEEVEGAPGVRFRVKEGIEGYELCITTLESFKKRIMVGDDSELIKVTTIPYSVFNMPNKRFGVTEPKFLAERLAHYGWTVKKLHGEQRFMGWPEGLNHKFFHVTYKYI